MVLDLRADALLRLLLPARRWLLLRDVVHDEIHLQRSVNITVRSRTPRHNRDVPLCEVKNRHSNMIFAVSALNVGYC